MAYVNQTARAPGFLTGVVGARIDEIRRRYQMHRVYRDTVAELSALSDRELFDLNISRADIHRVARGAVDEM